MKLPRPIVFGNWKMNGTRADGLARTGRLVDRAARLSGTLGVFPPATLISSVVERIGNAGILVGGQDCHEAPKGAHTGSISAEMLRDAGATAVILGHSERRHGLGESSALIARKIETARAHDLLPVLCIGESEEEWQAGRRLEVLERQLDESLPSGLAAHELVIAYEPVWAIGTGRTPSLEDIAETHAAIRERLAAKLSGGSDVPLLYGGSVKAQNAHEILSQRDVDGALVGGASLDAEGFWAIYTAGGGT